MTRILELDLDVVAVDGSLDKALCGGEGTGKNPTDRAKLGWKWSLATERAGIPVGWAIDGANRNDIKLLDPTLDAIEANGLLADIGTLAPDRDRVPEVYPELDLAARQLGMSTAEAQESPDNRYLDRWARELGIAQVLDTVWNEALAER